MALGTHFSLAVNATARKEEQGGMGTAPSWGDNPHGTPKNGVLGIASWWWMRGWGRGGRIVALGLYFGAGAAAEGRGESLAGMGRVGVRERQHQIMQLVFLSTLRMSPHKKPHK